jgi:hypothetical protein
MIIREEGGYFAAAALAMPFRDNTCLNLVGRV